MNRLKQIISWTIWSVIALNLLVVGLSRLPFAQRFLSERVSAALSGKLATEVSIGRVDLGMLNRLIIEDVRILDQQKKEMLRAARLSVKVDLMPLAEGRISISSAQVFGAHLKLYKQKEQSQPNFQFVLDSLASKDTTSHTPLDLRINSLIVRHTSVAYDQYDKERTPDRFNPSHLFVKDISAHINLRALTDDSIHVNVKRLQFQEQSGLAVNRLSFKLEASQRQLNLQDFLLQMPSSVLRVDSLKASYMLDQQKVLLKSLSGSVRDTHITPSDLRCFVSSLKNLQRPVLVTAHLSGNDKRMTLSDFTLTTKEDDLHVEADGWMENWLDKPIWQLQLNRFQLSDSNTDFLTKNIDGLPLELANLGNVVMSGSVSCSPQQGYQVSSIMQTDAGNLELTGQLYKDKSFEANMTTDALNLGRILTNERLGSLSSSFSFHGSLQQKNSPTIAADGGIHQFTYNDYPFSNIQLNALYEQGTLAGQFSIDDPNVSAEFQGQVSDLYFDGQNDATQHFLLKGSVKHVSPMAARLTDMWGEAHLSADIDADFSAKTINDANGSLRISNFMFSTPEETSPYFLNNLMVASGYDQDIHYVTLKSDFADAELRGHFDYSSLRESLTNLIGSRLPTLPGLPTDRRPTDNNFSLRLMMSKSDWMQRLFNINLQLRQPLSLYARINAAKEEISLNGTFPSFAYNDAWYSDGSITVSTPAEDLLCRLSINKLTDEGHVLELNVVANAKDNRLTTAFTWDNHLTEGHMSGELNSVVNLYKNIAQKPEAHVTIRPSHLVLNNRDWEVEPSDILYTDNHLLIDNFSIRRGSQHILIDGIGSKYATDTLHIDLKEVDVRDVLDLVNFHSVEFDGKATGIAYVSSVFGDFAGSANLNVGDFKFERGGMGDLTAHVAWNQEKKQIDIDAIADDGTDAMTYINGYVSPPHNTIDLGIQAKGTSIEFMHNFTKSFISKIDGHAEGYARVAGTLDNINLTGRLVVDGEATITPLNTTYTLRRDTVVMIPDEIELRQMAVYDQYGNQGILSGGIHHQHLTNLTFDLNVEADNLLAYDFKDFGESSFYGTVFASGNVAIHGANEVVIDCNITPQKNSVFVYNAANPDAISKQEFIEWDTVDNASPSSSTHNGQPKIPLANLSTDIYINFLINTTPDATIRLLMDANTNDYITLNGDGSIRATFHNKGPFNMFGTYTVEHGTYGITIQNIIKKNFTFNRGGTIVFGGDPYNAALNLQAVYTVNGVSLSDLNIGNSFTNNTIRVNCLMNIGGIANSPQVDFDLEMPTVNADEQQMVRSVINGQQEMNQQVIYLLGIGRFYNQGANNSNDNEQADQTSLAMQSFLSGTLSTQINTLLSQFVKNDNWNFGANISTGNEGWHNAEYEGIIIGRMFNNRLLLNGQFGYRDNATQANPSFIGDFDIQYLLYPNGNLALKVYNQTNDRYFTKSSLNTQGIGLIMKKDFNGIRDLFSTSKKSKKKKKKTK